MAQKYLIGVDLGTSGTKAAIYTIDGKLIAESCVEVPILYPKPGIVEQDMVDFYTSGARTVKACIQQSGIDPKDIAALAFDSQMAGLGLVNDDYEQIGKFDSWLDMRCQPYIKTMEEKAGERIAQLTGCAPTCDHGPKMLWWQNEEPELYKNVAKFVMPAGYVVGKLCNLKAEEAFIDYTFIHFSGVSDARNGCWSTELCDRFAIDMQKLPEIVEPWKIVGKVSPQGAMDFGLAEGTIVAAGAGDTAANALGAGIVRPGQLFDVAGTAAVLAGCTDTFVSDIKNQALLTMRSVIPGLWNPLAYIAGGGIILRWIRDELCCDLKTGNRSMDDIYAEMINMASEIEPGCEGLLFSPHLGGRICPSNPEMRGGWIGLSWSHSKATMIRSALESVAFEYAYYLKILKELLPELELIEARVMGGGAKSPVWNQIKADVLNVPYVNLVGNEFGTWGAAMIAGKAAGVIDDLALHATECTKTRSEIIQPDMHHHEKYVPIIDNYIRMQELLDGYYQ